MSETTARLALPMIAAGQAQKELSHNEALAALDLLVQAAADGVGINTPPGSPAAGQCWIVGAAPTGAWSGQAGALAGWTGGGWRFVAAREGMTVWTGGASGFARYSGGAWVAGALAGQTLSLGGVQVVGEQGPAIAEPTGGSVTDAAARAAIGAILTTLRTHGLIAT